MDVRSFVQSGQFTKAVVTSFSTFALVLPAACLMWLRTQAQSDAETFGSPSGVTEVDLEMGMQTAPRHESQIQQPFGMQMMDVPTDEAPEAQFGQPFGSWAPPWAIPVHERPRWMQLRQAAGFMAQPLPHQPGSEIFDCTFLGTVTDRPEISTGFGGSSHRLPHRT